MSSSTDPQLRQAGDRIESLLGELQEIADPRVRARAQEAVRLIVQLYGAALGRIVEGLREAGADRLLAELNEDELVASLLLVHGLQVDTLQERIEKALEEVRPYLDSHGGDVRLLSIADDTVTLEMLGSCDGCPSSAVTLELAVKGAIEAAAPEIDVIELEGATSEQSDTAGQSGGTENLIAPESLMQRPAAFGGPASVPGTSSGQGGTVQQGGSSQGPSWEALDMARDLPVSTVTSVRLAGTDVLVCRLKAGVYAYQDRCRACGGGLAEASLEGPRLSCPDCDAVYDVQQAGEAVEGAGGPLQPLPVLERDGRLEVAIPAAAVG